MLLIDESLCVRCDNCEKACAETHHGVSRLNREAGPTFSTLHVPTSCRHCEHPHCMKDCPRRRHPPRAQRRGLHRRQVHRLRQLRAQLPLWRDPDGGRAGGEAEPAELAAASAAATGRARTRRPTGLAKRTGSKHAVKCDMCKGIDGGPACVRACPTGAAIRVNPEEFISVIRGARDARHARPSSRRPPPPGPRTRRIGIRRSSCTAASTSSRSRRPRCSAPSSSTSSTCRWASPMAGPGPATCSARSARC